jgi:hypothetical protein
MISTCIVQRVRGMSAERAGISRISTCRNFVNGWTDERLFRVHWQNCDWNRREKNYSITRCCWHLCSFSIGCSTTHRDRTTQQREIFCSLSNAIYCFRFRIDWLSSDAWLKDSLFSLSAKFVSFSWALDFRLINTVSLQRSSLASRRRERLPSCSLCTNKPELTSCIQSLRGTRLPRSQARPFHSVSKAISAKGNKRGLLEERS